MCVCLILESSLLGETTNFILFPCCSLRRYYYFPSIIFIDRFHVGFSFGSLSLFVSHLEFLRLWTYKFIGLQFCYFNLVFAILTLLSGLKVWSLLYFSVILFLAFSLDFPTVPALIYLHLKIWYFLYLATNLGERFHLGTWPTVEGPREARDHIDVDSERINFWGKKQIENQTK